MSRVDVGYDDASTAQTAELQPLVMSSGKSADDTPYAPSPRAGIDSKPMHEIIKKLFMQRSFILWFIFKVLYFTQVFAAGLFIPLYAAEWFGGCLSADGLTVINGCAPNYSSYAYYATMFYSISGLITFLVSSFVGHLTDKYGRKPFFYLAIVTWMIPRVVMIFYVDFYLYFSLSLLEAINGGDFFIASKGYLADIIPNKEERIIGYGFGQSSVGIGCILGSIFAVCITTVWNDHTAFIALGIFYVLLLIYTRFGIQESYPTGNLANRSTFIRGARNPFQYLGKICKFNLILYLSLLSLIMAIVESGIMASLFSYIGNEYKLHEQGSSTLVYGIFAVVMSIAVILTGFFLALFKKAYDELHIMVIAVCIKVTALLLLAMISLLPNQFRNYTVLYFAAFFYGTSFFIWPSITGLLTKYLSDEQQGTGFGIIDAWTAVANIIAPFSFGYFYVTLDAMHMPWILFFFAISFCVLAIVVILVPLKSTIRKQRRLLELKGDAGSTLTMEQYDVDAVRIMDDEETHEGALW